MNQVSLRIIDRHNVDAILGLGVHPQQSAFVAGTPYTLAQASTYPEAWLRAIYLEERPVGLIAMKIDASVKRYYLWRMLIDARFQGKGIGRTAIQLLSSELSKLGAANISIRIKSGEEGPEGFYHRLNFKKISSRDDVDDYELSLEQ